MKEDIKLPAIIDNVGYNQKVLIFKCGKAYHLEGDYEGEWSNGEYYIESQCKNITQEYLSNTYGKVESKEHAEFIVELAKANGFDVVGSTSKAKSFEFSGDSALALYEIPTDIFANNEESRLITIPLPPKQIQTATSEEEFEMQQIMKNNGDNLVLGCEESKCEEWPKVGDKFIHKGELVTCISKGVMSKGDEVITFEGADKLSHGSCWNIDVWVKKPKTPEEELRDDIEYVIHHFEGDKVAGRKWLMNKYNITKKPQ